MVKNKRLFFDPIADFRLLDTKRKKKIWEFKKIEIIT